MKKQSNDSLTKKQIFGYAMGDLGGCMTFAVLGSFLLPYYTEVAGISTGAVALMFLLIKIWDAINDPMMGALMDKMFAKSKNKHGKFRPWMMRATPLLFISAVMMYSIPGYVKGVAGLVAAYVTYLLYEASYTMFNIPYGSLLSAMAGTEGERATLSSSRGFGALIGNLIPMVLFPVIINATKATPRLGYTVGITVCAVIGLIACLLSCKWTYESQTFRKGPESPDEVSDIKFSDILVVIKKNRPFLAVSLAGLASTTSQFAGSTLALYLWRDVLGALPMMGLSSLAAMAVSFLVLTLAPKMIKKFGLNKTVQTSLLVGIVVQIGSFFALSAGPIAYILVQSLGSAFASVPVFMQWGMVGDAIDYNEMITGKRTEGSIYGTFNLSRRFGQAIGSSFAAFMLGVIGFNAAADVQSAGVVTGIKLIVVGIPLIMLMLSYVALRFVWNITPEVRERMTAFHATAVTTESATETK